MGDLALIEVARVETFEREESRFEQKWSKAFYGERDIFLFPRSIEPDGSVAFNVSSATWLHGIHTPVYLSARLYAERIRNGIQNPIKNIETLAHAFLYAVDSDNENNFSLSFTVPGNNGFPYKARAVMRGFMPEYIFIETAEA